MTWREYETGLEDRLVDLHSRVHRGSVSGAALAESLYSRRPTGGNVRWALRRWRTRSSNRP